MIDLEGQTYYAEKSADLPQLFHEVADAWADALKVVRSSAISSKPSATAMYRA